jgi:hypothetical protein
MTTVTEAPRALTPSDKRSLEKLVSQDFEQLAAELTQLGAERAAERAEEFRASQRAVIAAAAALQRKLEKAWADLAKKLHDIAAEARAQGFDITTGAYDGSRTFYRTPSVDATVVDSGAEKAATEARAEVQRALVLLGRKRNEAKKVVLLAGLSDEARSVLDSIPTAPVLLAESRLEVTA